MLALDRMHYGNLIKVESIFSGTYKAKEIEGELKACEKEY